MFSSDAWGAIKICKKCENIGYCSDHCREEDENRHRQGQRERGERALLILFPCPRTECALVSLSKRKQYPHRAWFLARACLRVQEEGYHAPDKINKKKSRCFADLMDRKWLSSQ